MPWRLQKTTSGLSVDLRMPIDDIHAVLEDIHDELRPGSRTVTVRSDISSFSSDDALVVHLLCQMLVSEGIVVSSISG